MVLKQLAWFSEQVIAVIVRESLAECQLPQFLETDPEPIANILSAIAQPGTIKGDRLPHRRPPRSPLKRLSPESTESDICDRNLVRGDLRI